MLLLTVSCIAEDSRRERAGETTGEGEGETGEGEGEVDEGGGDGLEEGQCLSHADCEPEFACRAPGYVEGPQCGIPCEVLRDCESDEECTEADDGPTCVEYLGGCCWQGDPLSSRCGVRPACTSESCGEGHRCRDDGLCEVIPCTDEAWDCGPHSRCADAGDPPEAEIDLGADLHGCVRDTCSTGADCEAGGFCVYGACHATPGSCREVLPAVP